MLLFSLLSIFFKSKDLLASSEVVQLLAMAHVKMLEERDKDVQPVGTAGATEANKCTSSC